MKLVSNKPSRGGNNSKPPTESNAPKSMQELDNEYKPARKKRGKAGLLVAIFILLAVILIGGVITYAGFTVQNSNSIFPGVTAYGMDLGGETVDTAISALESSPEYAAYRDAVVTVVFPADIELTISSADAGLYSDPQTLADSMYQYGRNKGFLGGALTYLKCIILPDKKALDFTGNRDIDRDTIAQKISSVTSAVDRELMENTLSIEDDEVVIIKGASGMMVNDDEVLELVIDAFEAQNYTPIEYLPATSDPKEVDLNDVMTMVYKEPVNATFDDNFNIVDGEPGVSFDIDTAQRKLDSADVGDKITIPLIFTDPEITSEGLTDSLFADILSEHTTKLAYNPVRSNNVELAASTVDGTILLPGDVFSYNDVVGERTKEKGYGEAPAYVNGETELEIGGGICQVSSTIYYCAMLANLEIVERTAHTFSVAYLPPGMDATVSWGGPNFRFRNNAEYPIKIHSWREGDYLHVQILGTKTTDEYVKLTYEILGAVPFTTEYVETAGMAAGTTQIKSKGSDGSIVKTYRAVYSADGTELSKEVEANSRYKGHKQVVLIPEGESAFYDPDATPSPDTPTPAVTAEPQPTPNDDSTIDVPPTEQPPADVIPPPSNDEQTVPDIPEWDEEPDADYEEPDWIV